MIRNAFCRSLWVVLLGWSLSPFTWAAETAPAFTLPTNTGQVTLSELQGKVVYLDFWASWCPPCRQSFPWMNEMQRRYADQGLAIVAINLDKERSLVEKFLQETPAEFTIAYDPDGQVAEAYRVGGMPSSYIIDRAGQVVKVHLGFRHADSAKLERALRQALEH